MKAGKKSHGIMMTSTINLRYPQKIVNWMHRDFAIG